MIRSATRNLLTCAVLALAPLPLAAGEQAEGATDEQVGRSGDGRIITPVNQVLTPFGRQVDLPGLRPQAIALSPDGRTLVVSGKTSELVVMDPTDGNIRQRVPLVDQQLGSQKGRMTTGRSASRDCSSRRMASTSSSATSPVPFESSPSRRTGSVTPTRTISLPPADAPRRKAEIPSGLALSPDGQRLYVCANLSNRVHEIEIISGRILRTFEVGVAPYDVVLVGQRLFVSNWGGRRPAAGDVVGPAGAEPRFAWIQFAILRAKARLP